MKNHLLRALTIPLVTGCFALNTCETALAQAPQGIPYQAIARNASGVAIANTAVKVRFSIRDSIATGAIKYQETHNPTTSALGLFSLNVGMGTVLSGTFSGINWGKNAKFLQLELDPAGGNTYTDLGTTQMMSVPYALYAGQTSNSTTSIGSGFTMFSTYSPPIVIIPNQVVQNYFLKNAFDYCYNLIESGFSDWRLPTLEEIKTDFTLNGITQDNGYNRFIGFTTTQVGYDKAFWVVLSNGEFSTTINNSSFSQIKCVR